MIQFMSDRTYANVIKCGDILKNKNNFKKEYNIKS